MKKYRIALILAAVSGAALWLPSCKKDKTEDINTLVYAPTSSPQGASYAEWSRRWWTWLLNQPCDTNAFADSTGAAAALNQSGPVFFLAGAPKAPTVRNVAIPAGKDLFFPIMNYINDYPCPDTSFHPAPGESLESFLQAGAMASMDQVSGLEVGLDGKLLLNPAAYRITTGLFNFSGNPDMTACFDPCITGTPQDGISDGYWVMLKALPKGTHTLHFHGELTAWSWIQDVTYNLRVE